SPLIEIITATEAKVRDRSLDSVCRAASLERLIAACAELDDFRRHSDNLYEQVRALFFLYAIHRFHLPLKPGVSQRGLIPFDGFKHLLHRRFAEAIENFLSVQKAGGPSDPISSALAAAYQRLAFQTLADQVRRSVRSVRGNQWMFRMGHPADHPLRVRPELLRRDPDGGYPILRERTPVRMDLSHSGWSDIFFLGMDFPEGARVLNVSIDLGVHGRDAAPRPPVEAYLRVVDEPVLRLTSADLGASADIRQLAEVFDFARDYLGLLKAAVIAAGIVPPGIEGSGQQLADLLARVVGPGRGLEIVSSVNNIPKGSRLAVSTNLLASLISVCMRATGQARSLEGPLAEDERRLVLARALLGEWLGGSGGGWQDSGGVWPGMKLICGVAAGEGDPEFGVSRGRLMPSHKILDPHDASPETRRQLQESLVLVHGGMAQNVGPILEMVTEKYLLRSDAEWAARQQAMGILDEILGALRAGDVPRIGALTTRNFNEPIQTIIPWANNHFTESLIRRVRGEFGQDFWGFWMLGGMSGGGMGFIFEPRRRVQAQERLATIMANLKSELQTGLPFAMEPVVYDFAINERGTWADLRTGEKALLPAAYYALHVPHWLRADPQTLPPGRRSEIGKFNAACHTRPELAGMMSTLFDRLLPQVGALDSRQQTLAELLEQNGFDRAQHEHISEDLKSGRIGLAQNRLPVSADIKDVRAEDILDATALSLVKELRDTGLAALARGELAVVTLAAGVGSRWTQGAGVVKALHPFCRLGGEYRTFLETHLAKSRRISRLTGRPLPHIITTSYLTHQATADYLARQKNCGYPTPVWLSPGRSIGLRMIPMERDLRFLWEEMPQQMLDEQQQKVRDSLRAALINWARTAGEGSDYTDNVPGQCLHPVGHWFEVPNLLRNGVLTRLLAEQPQLRHLMLHNIDTLGADADPAMFGLHLAQDSCLTFEVITRRLEDRGGGLARVNGQVRLVEGLAMPREEEEFTLSYYNSNTCWIDIDRLLAAFGLGRRDLANTEKVTTAVRALAARVPTYVTIKDVKKRWGQGQEDIFPVSQFEKLWVDMTALPEIKSRFVVVPRLRGQQLKDQSQLDGWLRDGSAAHVEQLCEWA
ncbi:MAG TPA: UTP--glucose-1-phosphate uridylyltransferase, partial [Candidatus Acidoferrum sp.]|nr:UTP--glucose-1-phosphate uridylyltransferase [Candidatus Acidoferrum sp.]